MTEPYFFRVLSPSVESLYVKSHCEEWKQLISQTNTCEFISTVHSLLCHLTDEVLHYDYVFSNRSIHNETRSRLLNRQKTGDCGIQQGRTFHDVELLEDDSGIDPGSGNLRYYYK